MANIFVIQHLESVTNQYLRSEALVIVGENIECMPPVSTTNIPNSDGLQSSTSHLGGGSGGLWHQSVAAAAVVLRSTTYLASTKIGNNTRMGTDHIDDIRGATRTDEAPIPELPRNDGVCPLVQEAFDGVGNVADEVGRPLGVRRAGGRVAGGEPGDALAHTVAFADAVAFTNAGGLGNRRRKDRDDRGEEEGDGGELHCDLVLKTRG